MKKKLESSIKQLNGELQSGIRNQDMSPEEQDRMVNRLERFKQMYYGDYPYSERDMLLVDKTTGQRRFQ